MVTLVVVAVVVVDIIAAKINIGCASRRLNLRRLWAGDQ